VVWLALGDDGANGRPERKKLIKDGEMGADRDALNAAA
jgi:hypothetical protein